MHNFTWSKLSLLEELNSSSWVRYVKAMRSSQQINSSKFIRTQPIRSMQFMITNSPPRPTIPQDIYVPSSHLKLKEYYNRINNINTLIRTRSLVIKNTKEGKLVKTWKLKSTVSSSMHCSAVQGRGTTVLQHRYQGSLHCNLCSAAHCNAWGV